MPTWKKVIVSGSNANLTALQVDNLTSGQVVIGGGASNLSTTAINGTGTIVATTAATGLSHSGSFSGSFQGTATITDGNAFIQNGNSFGTTATLGTNDTQNLQFETSGSVRMTISSSGNVGIGITTPSALLHVNNTGIGNSFLIEDSSNPDNTPFVIDSIGNVGIGISTTSGNWVGTASLHIVTSGSNSDRGSSVALRLRESASNAQFNLSPFSSSIAGKSLALNDDTTGNPLQVWTQNGNVGIGKETANARLDVSGSAIISGSLTVTGGITGSITASGVFGPYGANSVISASHAVNSAATTGTLTFGEGLTSGTFNGSTGVTLTVSGAAQLTDNAITKWNNTDNKFVISSLTDNGTLVTGASSIQLTGANSSLTGSFTGSFKGDGSGLTGLATTLTVSGSSGAGGTTISLGSQTLNIIGTANQIATSASAQTVTISLPTNVTIPNNLTVTGDLYVNGTTTTINTTELLVEDKFILLASGSANDTDGGIIIDRGAFGSGNVAFGYDADTDRWGYQNGLSDSTNAITISTNGNSAFAGIVFTEGAHVSKPTTGEFVVAGAIYTATDESIWMYS